MEEKEIQNAIAFQDGLCYSGAKLSQTRLAENTESKLKATRAMCPKIDTLHITLNMQVIEHTDDLQASLLHQVRLSNFNLQVLGKWASYIVHSLSNFKAQQKGEMERVSDDILSVIGLNHSFIQKASGFRTGQSIMERPKSLKKVAFTIEATSLKCPALLSTELSTRRMYSNIVDFRPFLFSSKEKWIPFLNSFANEAIPKVLQPTHSISSSHYLQM